MITDPKLVSQLHTPALNLITQVESVHKVGGGELSLLNILESFGVSPALEVRPLLESRDVWIFEAGDESGGAFRNDGQPLTFRQNGVDLSLPALIHGRYILRDGGVLLEFDAAHAPGAKLLLVQAALQAIEIGPETFRIATTNAGLDVVVRHAPKS